MESKRKNLFQFNNQINQTDTFSLVRKILDMHDNPYILKFKDCHDRVFFLTYGDFKNQLDKGKIIFAPEI